MPMKKGIMRSRMVVAEAFQENLEKMDDGLNLARVKTGTKVGNVSDRERVPKNKEGVYAKREEVTDFRAYVKGVRKVHSTSCGLLGRPLF